MKKLLIASLLFAAPVMAQEKQTPKQMCAVIYKLSKSIMTTRQNGVNVIEATEHYDNRELTQKMVLEAYSKPLFSTHEHKHKIIKSFSNKKYVWCMKALLSGE